MPHEKDKGTMKNRVPQKDGSAVDNDQLGENAGEGRYTKEMEQKRKKQQ